MDDTNAHRHRIDGSCASAQLKENTMPMLDLDPFAPKEEPPKLDEIKKEKNHFPMLIAVISAAAVAAVAYVTFAFTATPK